MTTMIYIAVGIAIYVALGSLIGRRLRRNRLHQHPPVDAHTHADTRRAAGE